MGLFLSEHAGLGLAKHIDVFSGCLARSDLGATIGNIRIVAPTWADDIAILGRNEHEIQALLDIIHNYRCFFLAVLSRSSMSTLLVGFLISPRCFV
jgi:hypothetical protein